MKRKNHIIIRIAFFFTIVFFIPTIVTSIHNFTHSHELVCHDTNLKSHLHNVPSSSCKGDDFFHRTIDYFVTEKAVLIAENALSVWFILQTIDLVSVSQSFQSLRAPPVLV